MKKTIFLFCILGLVSCSKNQVKISGRLTHADGQTLHLDEVNVYDNRPVDSTVLDSRGKFRFSYKTGLPGFYQLRLPQDKIIVLFPEPGEHIRLEADAGHILSTLRISGSGGTEDITRLIRSLENTKNRLDSVNHVFQQESSDSARIRLSNLYQRILEQHRKASIAYILSHYKSLTSIYALYQQYQPGNYVFFKNTDLQFFKIVRDSLLKYYPGSKHVQALKANTDKMLSKYNEQRILQHSRVVEGLPYLALPDMKGDTVNIQSLKGKVVLLSFWMPDNTDCVSQNLALKKVYGRYHKKGFEILQVALTPDAEGWQREVHYDELPWINLIDQRFPNSVVAGNYNVTDVPSNYLIAQDNLTILAKDMTVNQLQDRLQELLH